MVIYITTRPGPSIARYIIRAYDMFLEKAYEAKRPFKLISSDFED